MRKQEILHFHRLLNEIVHHEYTDDISIDLESYYALETAPQSIHLSKGRHKTATFELVECLTEELEDEITKATQIAD